MNATAADAATTGSATGGSNGVEGGWQTLVNIVSAIASGIGIIGFVTLCGGALRWVRFHEAGLPATDSVAVVPKETLVTAGAHVVVPATVIALAFVALLYVIDSLARPVFEGIVRDKQVSGQGAQNEAARAQAAAERDRAAVAAEKHKRDKAEDYLTALSKHGGSPAEIKDAAKELTELDAALEAAQAQAKASAARAKEKGGAALKTKAEVDAEVERLRTVGHYALTALAFVIGVVIALAVWSVSLDPGRVLVFVVTILAATVFSLAVLARTGSFAWFALSVVIVAALFAGFIDYYRTVETTKVEPAAAIRKDRGPVYGMFVAQTSDRVYIGTKQAGSMALTSLPRDEVVDLAVGELMERGAATKHAARMALDLCAKAKAAIPPPTNPASDKKSKKGESKKGNGAAGTSSGSGSTQTPPQPPCQAAQTAALSKVANGP